MGKKAEGVTERFGSGEINKPSDETKIARTRLGVQSSKHIHEPLCAFDKFTRYTNDSGGAGAAGRSNRGRSE